MSTRLEQEYLDRIAAADAAIEKAKREKEHCRLQLKQVRETQKRFGKKRGPEADFLTELRARFCLLRTTEEAGPGTYYVDVANHPWPLSWEELQLIDEGNWYRTYKVRSIPEIRVSTSWKSQ